MRFDFSRVEEGTMYTSVPEGTHVCHITEVRERSAKDGSPRWSFRLAVSTGEFAGRTAGWDSITWSERGVHRVQQVLCAFGIDARGELELDASELIGCRARVRFETEEREDPETGRRNLWLRVPYAGYSALEDDDEVGDIPVGIDAGGGRRESSGDGPSLEGAASAAF
jgi:hypothetical protein